MNKSIIAWTLLAGVLLGPLSAHSQLKRTEDKGPAAKEVAPSETKKPARNDLAEGGPTVVCDGKGGYRVDMKGKDILMQASCLRKHEESHIEDFNKTCPVGCKGQPDGTPHPLNTPRCPPFEKIEDWISWRSETECKSYAIERACLKELYNSASGPKDKVEKIHNAIRPLIKHVKCRLTNYHCEGSESRKWFQENCASA